MVFIKYGWLIQNSHKLVAMYVCPCVKYRPVYKKPADDNEYRWLSGSKSNLCISKTTVTPVYQNMKPLENLTNRASRLYLSLYNPENTACTSEPDCNCE